MYQCGEYIVYGYNGICEVKEITQLNMSGISQDVLYYVLCPLRSMDSKLYLPVENAKTVNRRIMTKEEAEYFLERIPGTEELWTANHKMREELYKIAMKTCDNKEWIRVIKTLYLKKQEKEALGKRISSSDERFLKYAEDSMFCELALALGMSEQDVRSLVEKKIFES